MATAAEALTLLMTTEEARAVVSRIKSRLDEARRDLLDLYEREGWRALGYATWRDCAVAEFGASAATLYRQLEAAEIERDVRAFSQVEKNGQPIPTSQLQAVKQLAPADRGSAFDRADELAGSGTRTAAHVQQAVKAIKPPVAPACAVCGGPCGADSVIDERGRICAACSATETRIAAIAGGAPALPDDIRQAAGRLELLIATRPDGWIFHWPEEDPGDMDPMDADCAREWLRDGAPRAVLEHLDRTLPADLQKAGYSWHSAAPYVIRHNDGWRGDAPTSAGAIGLARDRMAALKPLTQRTPILAAYDMIVLAVGADDARGTAIGALRLIEAVMARLPKTELQEDLSRAIADLNECAEGTEWAHWSAVGWALLDLEASE